MQARVRKTELDAFKIQAANIKTDTISPVLEFIKIEIKGDECMITKSNNKAFVIRTCQNDSDDCAFLVRENILNNFLIYSEAEFVNFTAENNRVKIYDDYSFLESPTERVAEFPKTDFSENEWIPLPKIALTSAGIASKLIFNGEISDPKSNVFIGLKAIAGTDGSAGFCQKVTTDLPEIILRKEVAEALSKMNSCEYSFNVSYDFFREPGTLFGFAKGETKFFNVVHLFPPIETVANFVIIKQILTKFCSLCVSSIISKSTLPAAIMRIEDGKIKLQSVDVDIKIETAINITGDSRSFKFNPAIMKTLLEAIPSETCYFHIGERRYYITDSDRSFVGIIMEII